MTDEIFSLVNDEVELVEHSRLGHHFRGASVPCNPHSWQSKTRPDIDGRLRSLMAFYQGQDYQAVEEYRHVTIRSLKSYLQGLYIACGNDQ